jgi:hypothetical protein
MDLKRLKEQGLRLHGQITRTDDEERMVYGVVTTEEPIEDFPGLLTILDFDATRAAAEQWAQWGNIREMHQLSAVGVAREITPREDSRDLYIGAHIVDDEAWEKVKSGVYRGFSIGADPRAWKIEDEGADTLTVRVTEYDIDEVSLCDRPADPNATIALWRAQAPDRITRAQMWIGCGDINLYPVAQEWDREQAIARLQERATEGERINWAEYGRAFLLRDWSNSEDWSGYRLPFADVNDYGELVAVQDAIYQAVDGLDNFELNDVTRRDVEERIEELYRRMGRRAPWEVQRAQQQKQTGGSEMELKEQIWRDVLGHDDEVPGVENVIDELNELARAVREGVEPGEGDDVDEPQDSEEPPFAVERLERAVQAVEAVQERLASLEARVAQVEAQPAPLGVNRTGDGEPSVVEQIRDLERTIRKKDLKAGEPEVDELLKLYEQARREGAL